MDVGITVFKLKDDDNTVEDNTVLIGTKRRFDLTVDITAKAVAFSNGGSRNYEPRFGLTTNPNMDPTDYLPAPYDASQNNMLTAVSIFFHPFFYFKLVKKNKRTEGRMNK